MKEVIAKLLKRADLAPGEMEAAMGQILEGKATEAQIAAFLTALTIKGETAVELAAAALALRRRAAKVDARSSVIVDTAGTGGDGLNTFNISTTTAFVVAAAGLTVAKHGNRGVSSRSGSADVMEKLGVNIQADPLVMEECLQQTGLAFLFAPLYHGTLKHAQKPRRELGFRTIFNLLGPLINPAGATAQLIGVYDPGLTETVATVLKEMGTKRAFVVHGAPGLDEASISGPTRVAELNDGLITTYDLDPEDFFGATYPIEALRGGEAGLNAEITKAVLAGAPGPHRDIVLLNAALAIKAGGRAEDIREGIDKAAWAIDSGEAKRKLADLIAFSRG